MKNNSTTTAPSPQELVNELRALVTEAEKMLSDSLTEHTAEAVGALRARFAAAQERLGELYSGARQQVVAGARYTDETIRANPYQSIAIAAGIGLLVGVLVARRGE